jgi:peptidoglycan/LPS O-acetylase OafA/YrhL
MMNGMVEISRYILAAIVAQTHLWPQQGMGGTGQISVFAFYTLSGYLMTRILHERYSFTAKGVIAFILNRVLRLWPAYLVLMILTLFALHFLPLTNFFFLIRAPSTALDVITNVAVIGQVTFDFVQWLPLAKPLVTSWSLSIEIVCYLLLALYFARTSARLWAFAVIGVIAMALSTMWCAWSADPSRYGPYCFQNRYGVVQAGFVPFAFGGLYYLHRSVISKWLLKYRAVSICFLAVAMAATFAGDRFTATVAPFIGIPLTWILVSNAPDVRPTGAQDFFGRASYHLFIAHMPVAAVLVTGLGVVANTVIIYVATIAMALGLSAVLVPLERRINDLRQQIALATRQPAALAEPKPPAF